MQRFEDRSLHQEALSLSVCERLKVRVTERVNAHGYACTKKKKKIRLYPNQPNYECETL